MLRKRKNKHPLLEMNVNVTSLMDILTTLLFFILMVLSFNKLNIIDAYSPQSGELADKHKKEFSLRINYVEDGKLVIDLGPLTDLKMVNESALLNFLQRNYRGTQSSGFQKTIVQKDASKMKEQLYSALIDIKKAFPHEYKATLSISDKILYQQMINVMEGLKQVPEDKAIKLKTLIGKEEVTTVLFPGIVLVEN